MADKTTTLKTKTNDNVYPNIIGDNRDNAIADSPQIKHTLTAEHKINLRLDTNVNNLINNSLQKPSGLTKTKLVGVGTNGQENIEIGDNLTLANGKLSATGGSSGYISISDIKMETNNPSGTLTVSSDAIIIPKGTKLDFNVVTISGFKSIIFGNTIRKVGNMQFSVNIIRKSVVAEIEVLYFAIYYQYFYGGSYDVHLYAETTEDINISTLNRTRYFLIQFQEKDGAEWKLGAVYTTYINVSN